MPPIATDVTIAWSVRLYVCMCVDVCRLSHACTLRKPLDGMNTPVIQSKIVLDKDPGSPTGRGDLGSEPHSKSGQTVTDSGMVTATFPLRTSSP